MKTQRFSKTMLGIGLAVLAIHGASDLPGAQGRPAEVVPAETARGPIRAQANTILVQGGRAYLGMDKRVAIATVVGRGQLREVGRTEELSDTVRDVVVANGVAYVAAGGAGVRLFDVSVPASPREIGSIESSAPAVALAMSGAYLYVAREYEGLQIVDISNPTLPTPVGSVRTDHASDVFAVGSIAYVADGEGGLRIIDVEDPTRPEQVGWFFTPGDANGVHVVGAYAYLAAGSAGLQIVNVSNRSAPVQEGVFDPGYARSVQVAGGRAYVAGERGGLWVIDVTHPGTPVALASFAAGGAVSAVYVSDGVAYAASASTSARAVPFDITPFQRR